MPLEHETVTDLFNDIADAIRTKTGGNSPIIADTFPDAILAIPTGGGGSATIESLSVTPSESEQTFNSSSVDGYKPVTVGAISSTYVGSGITQRDSDDLSGNLTSSTYDVIAPSGYYPSSSTYSIIRRFGSDITESVDNNGYRIISYNSGYYNSGSKQVDKVKTSSDLTVSGATVSVPAGYYASAASKSVASGSAGTPVATKGTVSNNSISITPSVTNTTGYITGDTKTGTAVSVSASELVSGTLSITTNGTKDVTNYKNVNVNISGDSPTIESLSITPSESEQTFDSSSVDGYKPVTVEAISSTYIGSGVTQRSSTDLTASGATVSVPAGYYSSGASKAVASGSATNSGTASASSATITTGTNTITLSKAVSITPSVSAGYISAGTAGNVTVSLTGSATIDPTPTASGKTVTIPSGYYTESTTTDVDTMILPTSASSSATTGYTSKATISRSTSDQYINIPTGYNTAGGYYKINAVANGSATGPSSLSGSSASITTGTNTITLTKTGVTTTPTVSAGYVASATASTATVALTASVTVNPTPTASGATVTIPAGYYSTQTTKSVSSGSATAPASISGTSATVSTGTNTLTLTKTVSVTPSVSAGYISSGTAGNSSVSLTASVTTKAAATITPGTSNQTIASGTYLTGTQTIEGDADLVAGNIKSGVQIFGVTGSYAGIDTSDATAAATDIVTGKTAYVDGRKVEGSLVIQKYYTGSSAPASSFGNNGDIYFQN